MKNLIAKTLFVAAFVGVVATFSIATKAEARNYDRCERPTINLNRDEIRGDFDKKFSYRVVVRGQDGLRVRTEGLPRGLSYNERTDLIEGYPQEVGTFDVRVTAENDCGRTYEDIVIRIRGEQGVGSISDANVTLDSELIINPAGSGVYLTQIPYTGAGDVLQYTLTILAMLLWGGAVAVAMMGKNAREKLSNLFFTIFALERSTANASVIDRSLMTEEVPNDEMLFATVIEDEEIEIESEKLQELRALASEEKVIFSEAMFAEIALKAETLDQSVVEFFENLIEVIKSEFPRVDGYIKIDAERLAKVL